MSMEKHVALVVFFVGTLTLSGIAGAQILEQPELQLEEYIEFEGVKVGIKIPTDWNGSWFLYVHGFAPDPTTVPIDEKRPVTSSMAVVIARRFGYATARSQHPSSLEGGAEYTDRLRSYLLERFERREKVLVGGNHMGGIISTVIMERYPDNYHGALVLTGIGIPQSSLALQRNFHIRIVFDYMFPGLPGNVYDHSEFDSWGPEDALELMEKADPDKVEAFLRMWDFPSVEEAARWIRMTSALGRLASPGSRGYDNTNTYYVGSDDDLKLNREIPRYRANVARSAEYGEWNLLTGRIKAPILAVNPTYDFFIPIRSRQYYDELTLMTGTHELYVQKWLEWPDQLLPAEVIEKAFGELHDWVTKGIRPEPGEITFDREAVKVRPTKWFGNIRKPKG
jgi:pimeloyl-ACP methyl ester carboxylesterase